MPIEIVSTATNPSAGIINENDLKEMKDDFINEADVKPCNGRTRLIKKFSVSLMKEELKNLISFYEQTSGIDVVKINFSIHINPFTACSGVNYSDSLTIVAEAATFIDSGDHSHGHVSHVDVGDFVIIPGYTSVMKNGWGGFQPCCPSSNP